MIAEDITLENPNPAMFEFQCETAIYALNRAKITIQDLRIQERSPDCNSVLVYFHPLSNEQPTGLNVAYADIDFEI